MPDAAVPVTIARVREASAWREFWQAYSQSRGALIGLTLVIALILLAILADVASPYAPNEQYREFTLTPPAWDDGGTSRFLLGTDPVGRDMLSRLIHGTRLSLLIGVISVAISLGLGIVLGLSAGFFRGPTETIIMRVMDVMLALPSLLLAIAVVAILGPGLINAMYAIAIVLLPHYVRLTRGEDVKAYVQSVEGRINALARVHTVLSLSSWQGAEIRRLVDEELAPYSDGNQIALAGPEIQLQPTTAQTLALALHELVTNSAKYGALSTQAGHLSIEWGSETGLLRLAWEETGGPPVQEPTSRGFGTRSVIASIESQLGGQAEFDWRPEGLLCRLSVPLSPRAAMQERSQHRDTSIERPRGERAARSADA